MKKLLAISWCFPPMIYPRSIQVSRLLAALTNHGWQPDVVCVDPSSLRSDQLLDESLNRPAGGLVKKFQVASLEDWMLVRGLIRLIPAFGVLPDPKWVWKNAAFHKCASLKASIKYSAFISFAQPWTDHLVGLQLKELTGLPWIAHFSDPWADSPYVDTSRWVMQKRLEMETTVIKNADAAIFVSEQTADLVMKKYPAEWLSKVHIIPHGFEPLPTQEILPQQPDKLLELVYTGGFYGNRTPEPLLQAIFEVQKNEDYQKSFRIRFIGPIPPTYQQLAERLGIKNCIFEGPSTHAKSQKACQNADVLLLIDAPSDSPSVFLPSKLVDYLAFNKPILGITPTQGASADLLHILGFPTVDPSDRSGIAAHIRSLVDANRIGRLSLPDGFAATAGQYQIENAAAKLDQVLEKITL
ncbi:MAG: glycosyltransferase [Leptolinea sp.]